MIKMPVGDDNPYLKPSPDKPLISARRVNVYI